MSRRCKIVRVPAAELLWGFFRRDDRISPQRDCWIEGIPDGSRIVKSRVNDWSDCVEFLLHHDSFDENPEGAEWPFLEGVKFHSESREDAAHVVEAKS